MAQPQIFISYRRDDAAGYARAIYDELARRYGPERVFIDVDDIAAGQVFDEVIQRAMGASHVLLVLIGKRWLGERAGQPARIFEPGDLVQREVATALARGLRVIPLLLDGAPMPGTPQLPEALWPLTRRNALELDNARFAADLERLVDALRESLGEPRGGSAAATAPTALAAPRPAPPRRVAWLVTALVLAVAAAVVGMWVLRGALPAGSNAPAAALASRAAINGTWQAQVEYDWPNARFVERFEFSGEGAELRGAASFLGVPRGLLEGSVDAGGLRFVTRTRETGVADEVVHRYRGTPSGDAIRFVMQTEGGSSAHVPVEFVARRVAPPAGR